MVYAWLNGLMSLRVQYSAVEVVANAVAENKYLSVAEYFAGRSGGLCSRGVGDVCAYVGIVLHKTDCEPVVAIAAVVVREI